MLVVSLRGEGEEGVGLPNTNKLRAYCDRVVVVVGGCGKVVIEILIPLCFLLLLVGWFWCCICDELRGHLRDHTAQQVRQVSQIMLSEYLCFFFSTSQVLLCLLLMFLLVFRVPHDAGFPAGVSCVRGHRRKTVNRFFRKTFFPFPHTHTLYFNSFCSHSVIISYRNTRFNS